ncbi:membrane protein [Gordonia sihwensis]|nr:hypothetical protein Y710_17525 [Gordonia sp. QH-12]MBY4569921.1 membrane protein [Gordonia sihwensis]
MSMTGSGGRPTLSRRAKILIGIGVGLLILLLVGPRVVSLITDWLWYSDLGYSEVMSTMLTTRLVTFLVVAVVVSAIVFGGIFAAYRARPDFVMLASPTDPLARYRTAVGMRPKLSVLVPSVFIGIVAGLIAQGSWATVQMFINREPFGIKDPQFGLDIGFYSFSLPFFRMMLDIIFISLVIAFIGNLITHYVFGGLRLGGGGRRGSLTRAARIQLAVIAGLFMIAKAIGYWFDRYDLLSSDRRGDIFTGATYTDINYVLPSKLILMAIAIVCAIAFFAAIALRDLRIPALAAVLMLLSALVIGVAWPAAMEQFAVKPSADTKEAEYIERNIAATTEAYRIRNGKDVVYDNDWARSPANPATVNSDAATLSNIRILDPAVMSTAFSQRQALKNVYGFPSQLAVDRYPVTQDGETQQRDFIVAARELDPSRLSGNQNNWLNKHTVFTHGNGFIAAQANKVDEAPNGDTNSDSGGLPVFLVSDVNTVNTPEYKATAPIKVREPRIYFGEMIAKVNPDYAIVGTGGSDEGREYDGDNENYRYRADSGVPLSNWGTRLLYALKYGERNFILSSAVGDQSRILYDRDPRDRVKKVAPWLTTDSKTYPAVMADGSIKWIVDGYTTLDNYPYAQRMALQAATADSRQSDAGPTGRAQPDREVSYVRNSVKATVDAYTGKVELYQSDDTDPVLKTWMKAFPGTVKPKSELDKRPDLRAHLRYPEDIFKLQRELLTKYHVNDGTTFFKSSNFWTVPADPTVDKSTAPQPPYYFTASAPGNEALSQFQLTSVMTALARPNLAAYMTAASDPDGYGKITVKTLPTTTQSVGPQQATEAMKNSPSSTRDRQLVENSSLVTYGNLLALPVGDNGILYVQPMYNQAKTGDSAIPKLYRVLTYYNAAAGKEKANAGYAPTVAEALRQVGIDPSAATEPEIEGGSSTPAPQKPAPNTQQPSSSGGDDAARDAVVKELGEALEEMRKAQSSGDFKAYGDALDRLNKAVNQYEALGN